MKLAKILEKHLLEGRFWTHSKTIVSGCTPVSPGCKNCWASEMEYRFRKPYIGGLIDEKGFNGELIEHPERMADILPKSGRRAPRVWTYWNDVFHSGVSDDFRDTFFRYIHNARVDRDSQDYHIICTKRPEEVVRYWGRPAIHPKLPVASNIIYLVSMENQDWMYERRSMTLQMSRMGMNVGILIEPMLGPVDISTLAFLPKWIICGPENGKGKRPFEGQWAMRLQAQAAGVPFFYKAGLLNGKRYIETP